MRVEKREWDNSRGVKRNVMAMAVTGIREFEELKEICVCVGGTCNDHVDYEDDQWGVTPTSPSQAEAKERHN